jgi:hypothetical protein
VPYLRQFWIVLPIRRLPVSYLSLVGFRHNLSGGFRLGEN